VKGDPDGARKIVVPGVRDDHAAAGPFHVTPRGFAGPNLLAMVLFEKFGQHQPLLNRQSERYRREGIDLSLSTLADQVGACPTALQPLFAPIAHRRAAAREDATVPILAKSKTVKGHIWTCVRDDWPFGEERLRVRREQSAPLVAALEAGCASSGRVCRARPRSPSRPKVGGVAAPCSVSRRVGVAG
jgi:transposase